MDNYVDMDIQDLSAGADAGVNPSGTPDREDCEPVKGEPEAYRVFRTQQEFQQCIDKALGKRLARARAQGEELSRLRPVVQEMCRQRGVEDIDALRQTLRHSEDMQADEEPMDEAAFAQCENELVEKKGQLETALAAELEQLSAEQSEFYQNGQASDLLADSRFCALLQNGFSVKEAFDALHLSELIEAEKERACGALVREIRLRGLRPEEDAVSGYGSFSASLDPRQLSDAQRASIRERVRRGERITF